MYIDLQKILHPLINSFSKKDLFARSATYLC